MISVHVRRQATILGWHLALWGLAAPAIWIAVSRGAADALDLVVLVLIGDAIFWKLTNKVICRLLVNTYRCSRCSTIWALRQYWRCPHCSYVQERHIAVDPCKNCRQLAAYAVCNRCQDSEYL